MDNLARKDQSEKAEVLDFPANDLGRRAELAAEEIARICLKYNLVLCSPVLQDVLYAYEGSLSKSEIYKRHGDPNLYRIIHI